MFIEKMQTHCVDEHNIVTSKPIYVFRNVTRLLQSLIVFKLIDPNTTADIQRITTWKHLVASYRENSENNGWLNLLIAAS